MPIRDRDRKPRFVIVPTRVKKGDFRLFSIIVILPGWIYFRYYDLDCPQVQPRFIQLAEPYVELLQDPISRPIFLGPYF